MPGMTFLIALAIVALPALLLLGLLVLVGLLVASLAEQGPDLAGGGLIPRLFVRPA